MVAKRLYKILYRLGLQKPYWAVDRFRYLKRLSRGRTADWRYAAESDVAQFDQAEVVARITNIRTPLFFYCNRRSVIEAEILKTGAFQRRIMELGNELIKPGSRVVDVGSNIGAYALPWAALHADISVDCFEPHPAVRSRFLRNAALNGLTKRVRLYSEALSDRSGTATFHATRAESANQGLSSLNDGVLDASHADNIEVVLARLDDVLAADGPPVSLIKIDVQGHELEVLLGARSVIARYRPALIFEHEDGLCATADEARNRKTGLREFLAEQGYATLYISRWGADLFSVADWSRPLNGDLLALPVDMPHQVAIA